MPEFIKAPLPSWIEDTPEMRTKLANSIGEQKQKRYRLVTDDSGHWYSIPYGLWTRFKEWDESFQDDGGTEEWLRKKYEGPDFNEFRLNTHISNYTYTDLREVENEK